MGSSLNVADLIDDSEFADIDGETIAVQTATRDEVAFIVQIVIGGECVDFTPEKARSVARAIRSHADSAERKQKASVRRMAMAKAWDRGDEE